MKIAIIHPWFLESGGGERVVEVMADMFPTADIFSISASQEHVSPRLRAHAMHLSDLNKVIKFGFRYKRNYLMPLFPWAVESLDVSPYDLIISSSGPAVMGVNAGQHAIHISYCHTPQRAWWDLYSERQAEMSWLKRTAFVMSASKIRNWEFSAMQRVDRIVSNSRYVSNRVTKYFRRDSTVIYPPVNTGMGYLTGRGQDYYLSLSRLDRDKRVDLLILACNALQRRLVVVGTGRAEDYLRSIAGPTIEFLGRVPDSNLPELYANCRAFLFAADEDFGIAPVEAQSFGRPVVAYGHGGSLETVRTNDPEGRSDTGIFFAQQTINSVIDGIRRFEEAEHTFVPQEIQHHAREFDTSVFVKRFRKVVESELAKHCQEMACG
jgi:glycosyltransferase involved in cell wall biosynthesis